MSPIKKEQNLMKCPKCHTEVREDQAICPKCHKVLLLECPNCHELNETSVCQKCGYTILVKCSKCSRINHVKDVLCKKCKLPVNTSLAYNECETDEFASLNIKFTGLNAVRKALKNKDLYEKFKLKLKNILLSQLKNIEGKIIYYGDETEVNFNKELSFATSANKAIRSAIKIVNTYSSVISNIIEELSVPLKLVVTINKKEAENLQNKVVYENNVQPLTINKKIKKYLKGLQITMDQFVADEISKDFKIDSLYSQENNGKTIMFYELILDSYVLPPEKSNDQDIAKAKQTKIKKTKGEIKQDLYEVNTLDINAKCKFLKAETAKLTEQLSTLNMNGNGKIVALKANVNNIPEISSLTDFYKKQNYDVLTVACTKALNYKPWGIFTEIFKDYNGFAFHNKYTDFSIITEDFAKIFGSLFDLLKGKPIKTLSPEDARYTYMEKWIQFLSILKNTVIIIDGAENLDDTSIQTLELYFDKYKKIVPNFVFVTNDEFSLHSKIKSLKQTSCYTEITLSSSEIDSCIANLKTDASDFINSYYYEKIDENFDGSYLYFTNAIEYLKETGVIIDFENKYIIKDKKVIMLPSDLKELIKARFKNLGKDPDISFILAYFAILGERLDLSTLEALGIKELEAKVRILTECGLFRRTNNILHFNNYNLASEIINSSLKKNANEFLAKNVLAQIGKGLDTSTTALVMGKFSAYKEEYLSLWKNSQLAIITGDYDAYLKNCLGFLSLVKNINAKIEPETIEENKKEVYDNILMYLYSYSPTKIYFIENYLLMDAIDKDNDEKIVKLSNLMLQGALISSNYTDALGLLHNILSRMKNPTLVEEDNVNIKFLLLSLVNIEILYNIGDFRQCVEIAEEILSVLNPASIEKIKPASFSVNLFVSHLMDIFRLVCFAKLYLLDEDLDEFFIKIKTAMNTDLPEKECILAIKDYLAGKVYTVGNVEEYSAFSKVIFLILQEVSVPEIEYKRFAQNIYHAKLLASDINNKEIELLCDLLIAFAYAKVGSKEKAEAIYTDILNNAEKNAMFNILALAKYLLAKLKIANNDINEGMLLINDSLAMIRKYDNQPKIMYALYEKLYSEILKTTEAPAEQIEAEELKLEQLKTQLKIIVE